MAGDELSLVEIKPRPEATLRLLRPDFETKLRYPSGLVFSPWRAREMTEVVYGVVVVATIIAVLGLTWKVILIGSGLSVVLCPWSVVNLGNPN
jgi:hypothetical protein